MWGWREIYKFLNIRKDGIFWDGEGCRRRRFRGGEIRGLFLDMLFRVGYFICMNFIFRVTLEIKIWEL